MSDREARCASLAQNLFRRGRQKRPRKTQIVAGVVGVAQRCYGRQRARPKDRPLRRARQALRTRIRGLRIHLVHEVQRLEVERTVMSPQQRMRLSRTPETGLTPSTSHSSARSKENSVGSRRKASYDAAIAKAFTDEELDVITASSSVRKKFESGRGARCRGTPRRTLSMQDKVDPMTAIASAKEDLAESRKAALGIGPE